MAKKKSSEQSPSRDKVSSRLEEINSGIRRLQDQLAQIEDLSRDGFPYRDATRARVELRMRELIRGIFGEQSSQYQRHKDNCLKSTDPGDISHTLQILRDLILELEEQKLGLAGTPLGRPLSQTPTKTSGSTGATKPESATRTSSSPSPPPAQPPAERSEARDLPSASSAGTTPSKSSAPGPSPPHGQTAKAESQPPVAPQSGSSAPTTPSPRNLNETVERVRRVGTRFHSVARQLRLRSEYRPTLEVDDQYDVQDLFYALLRYEFDDIGTEEWVPSYAEFTTQTTFFLEQEHLAIVVKKTKQGRGPKELAEELQVDVERFAAHPTCKRLFCFVYDPEGRIGNPRGLEAELEQRQTTFQVEALVAPK